MKILSIECSASPASVALTENGKILSSAFVNMKLTHSQTLIPMIDSVLKQAMCSVEDVEGIAVAAGPGSFTGIRIGISAVKGLAAPKSIPCCSVSTLGAMAECFSDRNCIVCAVMDARCKQVYNALFKVENGKITRLCEDRALMCDELSSEIKELTNEQTPIIITGDGTELFYEYVKDTPFVQKTDEIHRYQNAVGVALSATKEFECGNTVSPSELLPIYLRLPQAERELKQRQEKERNDKK